jgi:hypothetical protein
MERLVLRTRGGGDVTYKDVGPTMRNGDWAEGAGIVVMVGWLEVLVPEVAP